MPDRKVVHVDMDAFYAAIEQRDDARLRGRPIAVGGASDRGVVMTASYEARPFGVRSAMPSAHARRLCPDLVFVRPRFDAYKAASRQIRAVFERYATQVEPLSLDEAYLDVTEPRTGPASAAAVAGMIKADILAVTGLTASAGVSFNKFLAKIASEMDKPDGLTVIRPARAHAVIAGLAIEKFHGVGPATARRMRALGIATGADLQARDEPALTAAFGRLGRHFFRISRALDDRPVSADRARKSLSVERTFERDLAGAALAEALEPLAVELAERIARAGYRARSLTLKVKRADFRILTRRVSRPVPFELGADIHATAVGLLARVPPAGRVRLLGLGVSEELLPGDLRQLELGLTGSGRLAR